MQSLLQILVVNPKRTIPGKDGRADFDVQDAECLMVDEKGTPLKVGVLRIPRGFFGQARPGIFLASFQMEPNYKDRTLQAELSGLQPMKLTEKGPVADGDRILPLKVA